MKIIVITPVKNESWILNHFLTVTSQFADHIIIADQNSTDNSLEIAKNFSKVTVFNNSNPNFNESERQYLLIKKARELFPEDKVILALDADEIISADSLDSSEWNQIKSAKSGTVLKFFKPNLYLIPSHYIEDNKTFWPLGFIDNNKTAHEAKFIHSTRVPYPPESPTLVLKEIKFLHLAYLRPNVQYAKLRFYTTIEKKSGNNPWYLRRRRYRYKKDFLAVDKIEPTPPNWLNYPSLLQLTSFDSLADPIYNWQDKKVAEDILKHPFWYFWLDDIWYVNWEKVISNFQIENNKKIIPPPKILISILRLFDNTINNK